MTKSFKARQRDLGFFTSGDVVRLSRGRITYRQLDYWIRIGLVAPDQRGRGYGYPRRFSPAEVAQVLLAVELTQNGVFLPAVRGLLSQPLQFAEDEILAWAGPFYRKVTFDELSTILDRFKVATTVFRPDPLVRQLSRGEIPDDA